MIFSGDKIFPEFQQSACSSLRLPGVLATSSWYAVCRLPFVSELSFQLKRGRDVFIASGSRRFSHFGSTTFRAEVCEQAIMPRTFSKQSSFTNFVNFIWNWIYDICVINAILLPFQISVHHRVYGYAT